MPTRRIARAILPPARRIAPAVLLPAAFLSAGRQATAQDPRPAVVVELRDVRSEGGAAVSADGRRVYFPMDGVIRVHHRETGRTTTVYAATTGGDGDVWDLALSPRGDLLAFTEYAADEQRVRAVPLDPVTGHAGGAPRTLSAGAADFPAISPDGRLVAFAGYSDAGEDLVVASVDGLDPRVLARAVDGGISPIRWTPDGAWIYYGENPWDGRAPVTYRVPAAGGAPDTVHAGEANRPGLSPDGQVLVVGGGGAELRVLTADGNPLRTLSLEPDVQPVGWRGDRTLVLASAPRRRTLRLLDVATGEAREIGVEGAAVAGPVWTPDGQRLVVGDTHGSRILLLTSGGELIREVRLGARLQRLNALSPDGRRILYFADGPPPSLHAVDLETGADVRLAGGESGNIAQPAWLAASDGVLLARISPADAPGEARVAPERVHLDGRTDTLPSFRSTCGRFFQLGDSTALVSLSSGARSDPRLRAPLGDWLARFACMDPLSVVRVDDLAVVREVAPPLGVLSRLTLAPDGRAALRASGSTDRRQYTRLLFFRADGTAYREIAVPFTPSDGRSGVMFLPGDDAALVLGQEPEGFVTIYRVDPATGRSVAVSRVRARTPNPGEDFDLSPDGRTVAYVAVEPRHLVVSELPLPAPSHRGVVNRR